MSIISILSTLVFFSSVSDGAAGGPSGGLQIVNGKLVLNDEAVKEGISVIQSKAGFLFFYIPGNGLWSISSHQFEGAVQAGQFYGSELELEDGGDILKLHSKTQILGAGSIPAWVKVDRSFELAVQNVMVGYGDEESAPYKWPEQIKSGQ
jgi:hypothetical protein